MLPLQETFLSNLPSTNILVNKLGINKELNVFKYCHDYVLYLTELTRIIEPSFDLAVEQLTWKEDCIPYGYFDYMLDNIIMQYTTPKGFEISGYGQKGYQYISDGTDYLGITIRFLDGRFLHSTIQVKGSFLQVKLTGVEIEVIRKEVFKGGNG